MKAIEDWESALQGLERPDWVRFVSDHSGLPGPRANLALLDALVRVADSAIVSDLVADGGEYPMMCAAAFFGSRAGDAGCETSAHECAGDERWRVREGVVIGLQHLGDRSVDAFASITRRWVDDPDPLVQRAAVAAVCEPRLLRSPDRAAAAIDICRRATMHLVALPSERRRQPDARTLRQALGYGWSVAVAAEPSAGLPAFLALDTADPDVAWIVSQNRRKKRLAVLLETERHR
ncbi:HEAT repeat domain-containing protein [Sanguibacter sp. 25GB23B1]|uniref:HEAT repeat domain-containing protein n=1 Tax=unclassified Sanguibacter TaxID=2645534 RepID=UPI0032AFD125